MTTELRSAGWGLALELDQLQTILRRISSPQRMWTARLVEPSNEPPKVDILFVTIEEDLDLTSDGLSFPASVDYFPLLTRPPLVVLHPTLATPIRKEGLQQTDFLSDFDVIWTPVREALTIEALRGAATILSDLSTGRRHANGC